MKNIKISILSALVALTAFNCSSDDDSQSSSNDMNNSNMAPAVYSQEDQMGRPAINTVFVAMENKDMFNVTIPSNQSAAYQANFQSRLLALNAGYTTNALGQDAATFTGLLATDVLNVSLDGTTTFFDGTNVLTGRALADDVISTELLLIFGGPSGGDNPGLTDDNVDANDRVFSTSFPYLASPW